MFLKFYEIGAIQIDDKKPLTFVSLRLSCKSHRDTLCVRKRGISETFRAMLARQLKSP